MTLRKFNNALSVVVIGLGLYIAVSPFMPQLLFWLRNTNPSAQAPYAGALAQDVGSDSTETPDGNRLVIPSIGIDEPIKTGANIGVINRGGTWLRPQSAEPLGDSNTVIVGHRFFGSHISTFYHLDKVSVGDRLATYWDGVEIVYEVTETKIVTADMVEIEAPTDEKQLTLYTCDPIWTAKNRLVVIAKPIEIEE